ncbi:MAG: UvrD-helicase domain-containing protein [Ignavibacteriaceae bacterium]|nr:UvrD-helicase domain-containing protein [Ignavibacteriaceae bacterium]
MKLTDEQKHIIETEGDIKINAVAGSGKTTTITHYAKARPSGKRILYLAFNKSVKNEATLRFEKMGMENVRVSTAHSLAYSHIVPKYGYKIGEIPRPSDLIGMLSIRGGKSYKDMLAIAYHTLSLASYFCNSSAQKVRDLNYLAHIGHDEQYTFVEQHYDKIISYARAYLAKMDAGEIDITHDFYLKKFQLEAPSLPYEYILFDEGQDASAAMLDVFLKQRGTKVIVGDSHQQIYSWRYAVNSMELAQFPTLHLTQSFRFPQKIADIAISALKYKNLIDRHSPVTIQGRGKGKGTGVPATIARTNLMLLISAIENVIEKRLHKNIYFEGGMHSYLRNEEGGSIYDVYNLYNEDKSRIKDELIKGMKDIDELEEYAKLTGDYLLTSLVDVVKKYRDDLPGYLKSLRGKCLPDENRHKADMIYTTVHKSKGLEYPKVSLVRDFINEKKIKSQLEEAELEKTPPDFDAINEEINILYVGITRAMNEIVIPREIHPDFQGADAKPMPPEPSERKQQQRQSQKNPALPHRGQPWDEEEEYRMIELFEDDHEIEAIARILGRTPTAIRMRLEKRGLL